MEWVNIENFKTFKRYKKGINTLDFWKSFKVGFNVALNGSFLIKNASRAEALKSLEYSLNRF